MNGFEDIEKKLRGLKQKTTGQSDERILDDSFAALEQSQGSARQRASRNTFIFGAVAAIIITAVALGLVFIFSRPVQQREKIAESKQPANSSQFSQPCEAAEAAEKFQVELEEIIAFEEAGDVNGLAAMIKGASGPAKIVAASYLAKMNDPRVEQILRYCSGEPVQQNTGNTLPGGTKDIEASAPSYGESAGIAEQADSNEQGAEKIGDEVPRVVSINPPEGSEMPLVCELEIVFDRPMDPNEFEIVDAANQLDYSTDFGVFENYVEYDASGNRFILPLRLPGNWNGSIRLQNFVSADGVKARPVTVNYHSLQKPFSDALLSRFRESADSGELTGVLKKIRNARLNLDSLCETVQETIWYGKNREITTEAVFRLQGDKQFYADISGVMDIPFYIGSDGKNCWFYNGSQNNERLVVAAYEDINEINVDICNPFDIKGANIVDTCQKYNLLYRGTDSLDGRMCYLLGSYRSEPGRYSQDCSISTWWIDAETFMPVQIFFDLGGGNTALMRFTFQSINEAIPAEAFSFGPVTDREAKLPEPLDDRYNTRFINCIDGSATGRMSVRWGVKGPEASSSSGLN